MSDKEASELELGIPGDIELPPTTTKLEDDNAYLAEVAINMALRRSTETAERTSFENAVPVRELDPPPTYDSVWTEQSKPVKSVPGHLAHSGPVAVNRSTEPEATVASHGSVARNELPKAQPTPLSARAPHATTHQQHNDEDEDSDFESRISTPRTLTPPTTVPPTLVDADEDEERRRWVRDERGGVRRA